MKIYSTINIFERADFHQSPKLRGKLCGYQLDLTTSETIYQVMFSVCGF